MSPVTLKLLWKHYDCGPGLKSEQMLNEAWHKEGQRSWPTFSCFQLAKKVNIKKKKQHVFLYELCIWHALGCMYALHTLHWNFQVIYDQWCAVFTLMDRWLIAISPQHKVNTLPLPHYASPELLISVSILFPLMETHHRMTDGSFLRAFDFFSVCRLNGFEHIGSKWSDTNKLLVCHYCEWLNGLSWVLGIKVGYEK